jgi:hypothetical protein
MSPPLHSLLPGLIVAVSLAGLAPVAAQEANGRIVVLQGLDKVTARISTVEAPIDAPVRFGTLEITARHCAKRPPEEPPETTAFLEIREIKRDEVPVELFTGWMFASSPALSALEHPVYDVWVIDCKTSDPLTPSGNE